MNIRETFLKLTSKTYPHGTEHLLEKYLPEGIRKDKFGNYFHVVGDGKSRVIFASHLDTVSGTYDDVIHTFTDDGKIVGTDGNTTLGADDKAGVTAMLYMIENEVPGLYYFFVGEEIGCVGSGKVSRETHVFNKDNYDKVISFDRRGNTSVITFQSSQRCCSEKFAETLCNKLNEQGLGMETDDSGVCTDSLEFIEQIPECTNISVGYMDEHTGDETQDLAYLERLCKACVKIDWDDLPTERDPSVTEYKTRRRRSWGRWSSWGTSWRSSYGRTRKITTPSYPNYEFYDQEEEDNYSLVCAYHDEYDDLTDDYGSDRITDSNPLRNSHIIDVDDFEDEEQHDACFYPYGKNNKDLYKHRNRSFEDKERFFESLRDKYLSDRLSDEEIILIKEQVLDMNDPLDASFAEEIDSLVLKNENY